MSSSRRLLLVGILILTSGSPVAPASSPGTVRGYSLLGEDAGQVLRLLLDRPIEAYRMADQSGCAAALRLDGFVVADGLEDASYSDGLVETVTFRGAAPGGDGTIVCVRTRRPVRASARATPESLLVTLEPEALPPLGDTPSALAPLTTPTAAAPTDGANGATTDPPTVPRARSTDSESDPSPALTARLRQLASQIVAAGGAGGRTGRTERELNLRAAPSIEAERLSLAPADTPFQVLDQRSGWIKARVGDETGWFYGAFVRLDPPSASRPELEGLSGQEALDLVELELNRRVDAASVSWYEPRPGVDARRAKTTEGVNLRRGPGLQHERITLLPAGQEVVVVDRRDPWLRVETAAFAGWLHSDYVDVFERIDPTRPAAAAAAGETAAAVAEGVARRALEDLATAELGLETARAELEAARAELEAAQERARAAEDALATSERRADALADANTQLEARSALLEQQLDTERTHAEALAESVEASESERSALRETEQRVASLEGQLATAREETRTLADQLDAARREAADRLRDSEELRQRLEASLLDAERRFGEADERARALGERLERESAKPTADPAELAAARRQITELIAENRRLAAALADAPARPEPLAEAPVAGGGDESTAIAERRDEPDPDLEATTGRRDATATTTTTETPRQPAEDPLAALRRALESWSTAWAGQDVDAYLSSYLASYSPPGISRGDWLEQRRQRLGAPSFIEVEVEDVRWQELEDGERYRAVFVQHYRSDTFSDTVLKTLEWQREGTAWRIAAESSTPM